MNGDLGDPPAAPPIGGGISTFKPSGTATITGYGSSSPRTKRPYISGSGGTPLGYSSRYGAGASYRLASLDRLAYRQKVYQETNGLVTSGDEPDPTTAFEVDSSFSPSAGSNITSITTTSIGQYNQRESSTTSNGHVSPSTPPSAAAAAVVTSSVLQNKREMFFKSDSSGGAVPASPAAGAPPQHPSTAPPAPPVSTAAAAPVVVNSTPSGTAPAPHSAIPPPLPPQTSSIASIKEQLLTTKEKKDHKDEENKENKMAKELLKERRPREVDGYVGFANLPNQVYRKAVKKGFEFSLMVVGESGLGKSTLINSMFLSDIYSAEHPGPSHRVKKTVQVETTKVLLKENGVNLMLTVVDTPGFGDAVDNSDCWQPIIDHIENKYEDYLNAESQVNRKQIKDNRIHCCVYFIGAAGHGLKPLDIEFMRRLHDKVNIIPVIGKADTLTPDECQHLKKQILNEIAQHKIKIYEFPDGDQDGVTLKMKNRVPFAVVGSNTIIEVDGKKVRGRKYPWGVVEVENLDHCDFIPLRNMMIRTHMQDLKDVTNNVHYENFRFKKLSGISGVDPKAKPSNKNPLAQMEEEKKDHTARMKKMEVEMEQVFEMKVKEKMGKLHELENDLRNRNTAMRKKVEADSAEMDEERERFERDRKAWEAANNVTVEELRRKSLESLSKETVDGKSKKKKGLF